MRSRMPRGSDRSGSPPPRGSPGRGEASPTPSGRPPMPDGTSRPSSETGPAGLSGPPPLPLGETWKLNLHIAVAGEEAISSRDGAAAEVGTDLWFSTPCEPVTLIPDRLQFQSAASVPPCTSTRLYFSIDEEFLYVPFFSDFGPLNLGKVYRYCQRVNDLLSLSDHAGKLIVHVSSLHPHRRANAAFLAAAYSVICLGKPPEEAVAPFFKCGPPLIPFRDASFGLCTYMLTLLDTARGIKRAMITGTFNFARFDIGLYERLEQFRNGDMNWLIPGKFLAFSGPLDDPKPLPGGGFTFRPHDYVPVFKSIGVHMVVRLNKGHYEKKTFTENGIKHVDLYYPDGSTPSDDILQEFLRIAEGEPGGIAVHCKAGLGRTGTCIGAYVMKHLGFTAREAIAWFRICRPGSVLGPQQYYLEKIQAAMWEQGARARAAASTSHAAATASRQVSAKRRVARHVEAIESSGSDLSTSNGGFKSADTIPLGTKHEPVPKHDLPASRVSSGGSTRSGAGMRSAGKARPHRSPVAITAIKAE